jgi:hypothetical protein
MNRIRPAVALCCLALPLLAYGQPHHEHAHEHDHAAQHGVHQHGVGALNLALDGQVLELEMSGPADNFLGFEHVPVSDVERQQAQQVLKALREPGSLFILPAGAGCVAESTEIHSDLLEAVQTPTSGDDAPHEHEHEHEQGEAHQDIAAHYRFRCDNPDALDRIELALFSVFPNTEKLLIQSVGTSGQQGGEVTASQPEVKL